MKPLCRNLNLTFSKKIYTRQKGKKKQGKELEYFQSTLNLFQKLHDFSTATPILYVVPFKLPLYLLIKCIPGQNP